MKDLNAFLRDFVAPTLKNVGFKEKGSEYVLTDSTGDSAFLTFSIMRIEPYAVVFHAQASIVPFPYWKWANRRYLPMDMPQPNSSGVIAAFSVVPPQEAAHAPHATGLSRTRWVFDEGSRARVGQVLTDTLLTETVPKMQKLLAREYLVSAIASQESPSIRRWDAKKSELVVMVDEYPEGKLRELLSDIDPQDKFVQEYSSWMAERIE